MMPAEKKPFGFYGVIMENDIYDKIPEFTAWLIEIKGLSRDELGLKEEKKLWQHFCDDYNTCTMSHEKYYGIEKWEKETGEVNRNEKVTYETDEDAVRRARRKVQAQEFFAAEDLRQRAMMMEVKKQQKGMGETERKAKMLERFEPVKTIEDMAKELSLRM